MKSLMPNSSTPMATVEENHGGGFEEVTPRKRKTLNHDAGGIFGKNLMQHLTEEEIQEIEAQTWKVTMMSWDRSTAASSLLRVVSLSQYC
jgi:hypothetical protein